MLTGALVGTLGVLSILVVASLVIRFCVCPTTTRGGGGNRNPPGMAGSVSATGGDPMRKGDLGMDGGAGGDFDDGGGSLNNPFGEMDPTEVPLGMLEGIPTAAAGANGSRRVMKGILKHPIGSGAVTTADGIPLDMPPPPFPGKAFLDVLYCNLDIV